MITIAFIVADRAMPTVSHFKIDKEDKLGHGQCGSVYKAIDVNTNKIVAAKEIGLKGTKAKINRVKRECVILKKIPLHQNIISYQGSDIQNNDLWIFMEYCPLKDLDEYCSTLSLSEDVKFDIMIQIANAIKHIHEQKDAIAHRDIKPENIMVTENEGKIVIKLNDFGTSIIADLTKTFTTFAGTMEFMAPELFGVYEHLTDEDTEKTYGLSVDIFSAGLLFEDFLDAKSRRLNAPMGMHNSNFKLH